MSGVHSCKDECFVNFFNSIRRKESMMKAIKLSVVLLAASMAVGCASKGDISNLQSQVDGLKAEVSSVKSSADEALSAAQSAESKAASAESAARRAAAAAEEVNNKLDRMFKKSMLK
jgi:outer membrane murein-binding lipoprotein Lpp